MKNKFARIDGRVYILKYNVYIKKSPLFYCGKKVEDYPGCEVEQRKLSSDFIVTCEKKKTKAIPRIIGWRKKMMSAVH